MQSADSGNLMLVVTDQTGSTISATAQTVPHGAERCASLVPWFEVTP